MPIILLFQIYDYYSSIILNSFSLLLFSKLCGIIYQGLSDRDQYLSIYTIAMPPQTIHTLYILVGRSTGGLAMASSVGDAAIEIKSAASLQYVSM